MNRHPFLDYRRGIPIALSFVTAITLAASSCDDDDVLRAHGADAGAGPSDASQGPVPDDGGTHRESQVLHVLITANAGEVEQGELARSRASSERVKEFAAMMITDHGAATERLASLAQQKEITPEANPVSDALKTEADTFMKKLEALSDEAFDKAYMDAQIVMHVKVKAIIDEVLRPAVTDPDLKDALANLRTTLEGHLLRAQQIRGMLDRDASTVRPDASTTRGSAGGLDGGAPRRDSGIGFN